MYAIVTKWTPLTPQVKYLSFTELENILLNDNINPKTNTPYIAPDLYDREIYADYFSSVLAYKTYFESRNTPILYYASHTNVETAEVITIQLFSEKSIHDSVVNTVEHATLATCRTAWCNVANVLCEIKKKEISDLILDDIPKEYAGLEQLFESIE